MAERQASHPAPGGGAEREVRVVGYSFDRTKEEGVPDRSDISAIGGEQRASSTTRLWYRGTLTTCHTLVISSR